MGKQKLICDWCGKVFYRCSSQIRGKRHIFCSRQCLGNYSSKTTNPERYSDLKNLVPVSRHMSELNAKMNPLRMTPETKARIREARLNSGENKSYLKIYGRHEHRVVAEKMLGRKLLPGEVIHHMDFNPRNNDPENLMIFHSQSDHARYHASLEAFFNHGLIREAVEEVMPNEVHAT